MQNSISDALIRDARNGRAAAEQRIKDCPSMWQFIKSRAREEIRAKRRFSMQQLFEEARKKDWTRTSGDPFRVNNSYSAPMARILIEEIPESKNYIKTRKSECDWAFDE